MSRNSQHEYHQYLQIRDVVLQEGEAACANGLTAQSVLDLIKKNNARLYERICWGQSGKQSHPKKSVYMALQKYCHLNDGKRSYSERPFFRLTAHGDIPLFTLKQEIWDRQRTKQADTLYQRELSRKRERYHQRKADLAALEGAQVRRADLSRERGTVARAFKRQLTSLNCEACDFSFADYYGVDAAKFIEAHHKNPLLNGERRTIISDFNAVCANCHRMLHWRGLRTVTQLRRLIANSKARAMGGEVGRQ